MATARPIDDEEWLTQYGTQGQPFRNEPRWSQENEVSLLLGRLSVERAAELVTRRRLFPDHDRTRYTTAGSLRRQGFRVTHTPTKRNSAHVSVGRDDDWGSSCCTAFDGCFGADGD